ncbi:MAG TPA: class I SAM-dependent methyltransferase [Clostridiales bacterium]|nr:class I SAM-dependent methyltransferase [Clostridiales bacterium]
MLEQKYSQRSGPGDGQDGRPLVLDLGCGTGSFCLEMARRGYDPIGIDASSAMLDAARQKALQIDPASAGCLFLQQDISQFELYGTVDLIVCLLDTVNHLTRPAQVRRLFRLCANYLNPGSLLIFDLATLKHLSRTLGSQIFFQDMPDFTLFWQNRFRPASGISRSELTLFSRRADAAYDRHDETIVEKFYNQRLISRWLAEAGLELLARHASLTFKQAHNNDERHFYVARKPLAAVSHQ